MSRIVLASLLLAFTVSAVGCGGGNDASVSEDYSTSTPRSDPKAGPSSAGGAGEKKDEADSSVTAPAPAPL